MRGWVDAFLLVGTRVCLYTLRYVRARVYGVSEVARACKPICVREQSRDLVAKYSEGQEGERKS
eukprot:91815-Pleurochrysis_carterae.AAC.3